VVFKSIFSKNESNVQEEISQFSYPMNVFSEDGQRRTKLFSNICNNSSWQLLPGRFGGEYNNDMLAYQVKDDNITLYLGLKLIKADKGIQLDQLSMGNFNQFSYRWLKTVAYSTSLDEKTIGFSNKLTEVINTDKLNLIVVYLDLSSQQMNLLPIEMLE